MAETITLFEVLRHKDPLLKFIQNDEISACIYPVPYQGWDNDEVLMWFYSRHNACQVFFSCSKEVADRVIEESWADVSYEFTVFVEHQLMPFCVENTDWEKCERFGIPYDEVAKDGNMGCEGTTCHCEPFGEGDFSYGVATRDEFNLTEEEVVNG